MGLRRQRIRLRQPMDIIQAAASAYLNVLRARNIERIEKENLKLIRENLERARIRVETGVAGLDLPGEASNRSST
jgi:outer membrane protein